VAIAALMMVGGVAAGLFGSLLGLGGGVLIVPLLTIGFGLDIRTAVGVSLVSVIMTSSAAAGVYLERHVANLRLGMSLELFTALGALIGGSVAFLVDERWLALLFAALLTYVAITMGRSALRTAGGPARDIAVEAVEADASMATVDDETPRDGVESATGSRIDLDGPGYRVRRMGVGVIGATGAGVVSALLGIGGGIIKVPLMHLVMGVPLRVATATSNLMVGITASASAVIYASRGGIDVFAAGPTAIGVFLGANLGSRLGHRVDLRILRWLFVAILLYTAYEMFQRGLA
jgi:uncharacterized membrane protein YfcA